MARGFINWIIGKCVPTFQLGDDDIVVLCVLSVVGPSGGGKSLFIGEATKSDLVTVGTTLRPCTAKVQAIRCKLTDEAKEALGDPIQKNIVFVDTPSFHATQNDVAAEKEMASWLSKSKSKSTLVGTIYVHRVETDPADEPTGIQEHLDSFAYAFPQGFIPLPQRLHAVLSYEGIIQGGTIQPRREKFQAQLCGLRRSLVQGGRLEWNASFHPDLFQQGHPETAWKVVVELFHAGA